MAKKRSSWEGALVGVGILIAIVVSIPKEVWLGIGGLTVVFFVVRAFFKRSSSNAAQHYGNVGADTSHEAQPIVQPEAFARVVLSGEARDFDIPKSPSDVVGNYRWVGSGDTVEIAGVTIPGGLIYVGTGLRGSDGQIEPALINPALKVARGQIDPRQPLTNYWPRYAECSPDARRAYLQWLAGGRNLPDVNIGYVFLFFYGLERRVLVESVTDSTAAAETPQITEEVRRLLAIYKDIGSFQGYASRFLDYIEATSPDSRLYLNDPPEPGGGYELPMRLRVGLGQLAVDQRPVPGLWSLAWALSDPNIARRTPVTRCAEMFKALFLAKYAEVHGDGLVLPVNRTKLKISYQPASAAFLGRNFSRGFGELPDVSALAAPVKKLQRLVDICTDLLDPYSRFIGRNPNQKDSLEAVLQLPPNYWPAPLRSELQDIKVQVGEGMLVMGFGELTGRLKSAGTLSRDKVLGLARALESLQLGMEPDVLGGRKLPKAEEKIALFAVDAETSATRDTPAYRAAVVTLELACSVALADGEASGQELTHLTRQIESWTHLSAVHRKRLKAHLRLQIMQPATLAGLKKKLEHVPANAKRTIAKFLSHLAEADGAVSPDEVKFLERVYRTLDVDTKLVYGDLHTAGVPGKAALAVEALNPADHTGFTLDPARIAELQKETERVTALLAHVFVEDATEHPVVPVSEDDDAAEQPGLLGLDRGYTAFLRMLISRRTWTRQELIDVAADMELMLDGALEHINEATLDNFDAPLVEGDDPVEINQEILERLPA